MVTIKQIHETDTDSQIARYAGYLHQLDRTLHDDNQQDETANFSVAVDVEMVAAMTD